MLASFRKVCGKKSTKRQLTVVRQKVQTGMKRLSSTNSSTQGIAILRTNQMIRLCLQLFVKIHEIYTPSRLSRIVFWVCIVQVEHSEKCIQQVRLHHQEVCYNFTRRSVYSLGYHKVITDGSKMYLFGGDCKNVYFNDLFVIEFVNNFLNNMYMMLKSGIYSDVEFLYKK